MNEKFQNQNLSSIIALMALLVLKLKYLKASLLDIKSRYQLVSLAFKSLVKHKTLKITVSITPLSSKLIELIRYYLRALDRGGRDETRNIYNHK